MSFNMRLLNGPIPPSLPPSPGPLGIAMSSALLAKLSMIVQYKSFFDISNCVSYFIFVLFWRFPFPFYRCFYGSGHVKSKGEKTAVNTFDFT